MGNGMADRILRELGSKSQGLTRTEISGLFGRNANADELDQALQILRQLGMATMQSTKGSQEGGRPEERWIASSATEQDQPGSFVNSFIS